MEQVLTYFYKVMCTLKKNFEIHFNWCFNFKWFLLVSKLFACSPPNGTIYIWFFFFTWLLPFIFHKQNHQSQVMLKPVFQSNPCSCFSFCVGVNEEILKFYTLVLAYWGDYDTIISWMTNHSIILVQDFSVNIISQSC